MTLPINVHWGPWSVVDQVALLDRDLLVKVWPELMLPARVRGLWESHFPELSSPREQRRRAVERANRRRPHCA